MSLKVSIITCVYNNANSLEHAIQSVLFQTYPYIEHIVVDGDSDDGSKQIIEKNIDKIAKFISEKDKGIYDALNKGLSLATGDVVGILHADDFFSNPQIIENIANAFQAKPIIGLYGDLLYVNKNNINSIIRYWKSCDYKYNLLKLGWMPPHPTLFVRRSVFQKIGNYNTNYSIAADYDFIIRLFLNYKQTDFFYLPLVITHMRMGGKSNRSLSNIRLKLKEDYIIIKKNKLGGLFTLLLKNLLKIHQFFKL